MQFKSGFDHAAEESLSYIRVDANLPVPIAFEPPNEAAPESYWKAPENQGKAVPYRFLRFEDLHRYGVHLSGFDVNGVYLGRSHLTHFDRERQEGRWSFDYRYLASLDRFEFRKWPDDTLELHLLSDAAQGISFVLGNVRLEIGEEQRLQMGIAPLPLIASYSDPNPQGIVYALGYDGLGTVVDHHLPTVGVERMVISRLDARSYRVCLIAHERILPVWDGVITLDLPTESESVTTARSF